MSGVLGHLCAHVGKTGPGKPPKDGEMKEMTRHLSRYLSVTEAPHNIDFLQVSGEETSVSLEPQYQSGYEPAISVFHCK